MADLNTVEQEVKADVKKVKWIDVAGLVAAFAIGVTSAYFFHNYKMSVLRSVLLANECVELGAPKAGSELDKAGVGEGIACGGNIALLPRY